MARPRDTCASKSFLVPKLSDTEFLKTKTKLDEGQSNLEIFIPGRA